MCAAHVHVCRHGQDDDNAHGLLNGHRDTPLTPLGREQAVAAAQRVRDSGVRYTAVYCSPLQRARATADIIAAALGLSATVLPDLIERDFGALAGQPHSSIRACVRSGEDDVLQGDKVLYFLSGDGVESFDAVVARAQRVLAHMDAAHSGEHVLLVCHGDIGKMLQAVRAGMHWRDALRQLPYFANTDVLDL